jgi:hypothetical protein
MLASSRFNLTGAPWVRVDGLPIVSTASQLSTMGFLAPLDRDRTGARISGYAWVGGMAQTPSQTCNDWTTASSGVLGAVYALTDTAPNGYTALSPQGCSYAGRVDCLQE